MGSTFNDRPVGLGDRSVSLRLALALLLKTFCFPNVSVGTSQTDVLQAASRRAGAVLQPEGTTFGELQPPKGTTFGERRALKARSKIR